MTVQKSSIHIDDLAQNRSGQDEIDSYDDDNEFELLSRNYNRGQNSLGHMSFALKEPFPVRKVLPSVQMPPLPPLQCWLLEEGILFNSSTTFSSAFNIAIGGGGGGDLNSKFLPKYKVCHEFCPRL